MLFIVLGGIHTNPAFGQSAKLSFIGPAWYIASRKSRHSFPPKFAPFWLASVRWWRKCGNISKTSRRQGPMPCPASASTCGISFSKKQKTSQASFSLQDCEIYWEARRKRNRTLILRRFHGVGACCSIRPVGKMKTTLQISDNAIVFKGKFWGELFLSKTIFNQY